MRNGTANTVKPGPSGNFGTTIRVSFEDGTNWVAKVSYHEQYAAMTNSINSLNALQKYCPHIPAVRVHGSIETVDPDPEYIFHFMDWVDGVHPAINSSTNGRYASLPQSLVPQLAHFVYNLSTCPLPDSEGTIKLVRYINLLIVAKLIDSKLDEESLPSFVNWAKARFISARRLLSSDLPPKGLVGLDLFMIMSWVEKQFASFSKSKDYVLHYWDLRPGNILVDRNDRIVA